VSLVSCAEERVWQTASPGDLWVMDKLILSRYMRYTCGPVGMDVPTAGDYIVRPCVNALGLGLGAHKATLDKSTDDLPVGHFWCEFFEGTHYSVDYYIGQQVRCTEGIKDPDTFTRWREWRVMDHQIKLPSFLWDFVTRHPKMNCEFIGDKLIEVHLRENPDFNDDIKHFIPVWVGEDTTPPRGYTYRHHPDIHGRIGAFVK